MALASPNALATLVGLENRLARLLGHLDFTDVGDPTRIAQIVDAIDESLDTIYQDAEWKLAEAEGRFKTFQSISGSNATVTNNLARIQDLVTPFTGVIAGDKINITPYEGSARIAQAGAPTPNDLDITSLYPGATDATATLSWEIVRDEYDMADDAWFITRVWDATNGNPLKLVDQEQLGNLTGEQFEALVQSAAEPRLAMIVRWDPVPVSTGSPTVKQNVKMRLYPAPKDQELEIAYSYVQVPTWQGTNLGVGVQMASTLLYNKAASILLLDTDDGERARSYEAKYQRNLVKATRRENARARTRTVLRPQFTPGAASEPFQIGNDPKLIQGN